MPQYGNPGASFGATGHPPLLSDTLWLDADLLALRLSRQSINGCIKFYIAFFCLNHDLESNCPEDNNYHSNYYCFPHFESFFARQSHAVASQNLCHRHPHDHSFGIFRTSSFGIF